MLEPFAASVLTSFLHARPPAVPSAAHHAALRSMPRALSADFFTPHPRRAKGKERACASEGCVACGGADGGLEGPVGAAASSSVSARPGVLRAAIPNRQRTRRLSNQRPFADPPRGRMPAVHPWHARGGIIQRRHASTQSRLSPNAPPHPRSRGTDSHRQTLLKSLEDSDADYDDAWGSYEALRSKNALESVRTVDLMSFAGRIMSHAGSQYSSPSVEAIWDQWGRRAQNLLLELEPRISEEDDSRERRYWLTLMVRASALRGNLDEALESCRRVTSYPIPLEDQARVVAMFRTLVAALRQYRGAEGLFEFVLDEWDAIWTYLDSRSVIVSHEQTQRPTINGVDGLRRLIFGIIGELPSPVEVLANARTTRSQTWRQRAGEFLIDVLITRQKAHDALAVLREIYRQGLHVPGYYQLKLVQALAKAGSFEIANPMFASLRDNLKDHHGQLGNLISETGLYLFAMQGNVRRAQDYFRAYRDGGGKPYIAVSLLLHTHAVNGDATAAVAVFREYCAEKNKPRQNQIVPNIVHYTSVIQAHAQRGDRQGMNTWLQKMAAAGHTPDMYVYNIILKAFAEKGEIISMGSVMDQMRAAGLRPDLTAYTTAITALAEKKDPVAAEALFRQAMQEGIVPDRMMYTALMNAHVNARSWQGAINVFDYMMKQARSRRSLLSIEVYNTLLKAYVSIGAPFSTVFRLFHRLEEMAIRPDDHTFALVMQSACDGNVMDVAEKLYASVKQMAQKWENGVPLTVYLATILLSGYLKHGDKKMAKKMYNEMISLGIQPSSVTFANIVKAYTNERSAESIQIAKQFLKDLMRVDPKKHDWMQNPRGVGSTLEQVYRPLLWIYAKTQQPGEVETLLQELFKKGGEPTLSTMTALLDSYRRTNNIEGAREVWPQIHALALELSDLTPLFHDKESLSMDDPTRPGARRQATILAIPLSIYIDALSANGYHTEVAKVWQEMKTAGFAFDSHNWNHLCVALIRAGEVERAFEVIERVIIPFRRALGSLGVQQRDEEPGSPLLTDRELSAEELSRPPTLWPSTARRRNNMQRLVRRQRIVVHTVDEKPQDFAHALHILRQVSPQWNQWRPHVVTLCALADALEHLQRGHLVQPLGAASTARESTPTVAEVHERAARAQRILDRLYDDFPNALEYVTRFIEWRKSHSHTMKKRGLARR